MFFSALLLASLRLYTRWPFDFSNFAVGCADQLLCCSVALSFRVPLCASSVFRFGSVASSALSIVFLPSRGSVRVQSRLSSDFPNFPVGSTRQLPCCSVLLSFRVLLRAHSAALLGLIVSSVRSAAVTSLRGSSFCHRTRLSALLPQPSAPCVPLLRRGEGLYLRARLRCPPNLVGLRFAPVCLAWLYHISFLRTTRCWTVRFSACLRVLQNIHP